MLKSHELLGFMSPTLATEIIEYLFEVDKPSYRATLNAVAEARKLRPVFLERQARAQRHATMLSTLSKPHLDQVAGILIRAWLVKKYTAMLTAFLDALAITHKEGVVEELPPSVTDEALKPAVEKLLASFPHEVVAVYLNAFNDMNEANWTNLKAILENDSRLQLGSH